METTLIIYLFPIVAAFALYLLKRNVDQIDKSLMEHKAKYEIMQVEIQNVNSEYLHKNDFKEFKIELWSRFDELKKDIMERLGS